MNWIWLDQESKNTFAEFSSAVPYKGGEAKLFISADFKYAAYLNGKFVSNGQYADLPEYKSVDCVDVTAFLNKGENELRILAWHMGDDFAVSRVMRPGIAFQVTEDGAVIAESSEATFARLAAGYKAGDIVTPQIGFGIDYDFAAAERPWGKCKVVKADFKETPRPVKRLLIGEPVCPEIVAQGVFSWRERANAAKTAPTAAERMQNAWMSSLRFVEMTNEERTQRSRLTSPLTFMKKDESGDGIFVIADMGREVCGHLSFSVSVDSPCRLFVGWGEHLSDLRIRTKRDARNFASVFSLKAGENQFEDYLRRLGCRYVCLFAETDKLTVNRLGIREANYPFAYPEKDFGDRLLNAVYETGRRTLVLCAHEHYEDCPWREQALYGMDSRNQMLFGYGAFGEYEFPRASLRLFARSLQDDGLIQLCAPARASITIPSFTAYWLIAIFENAEADYDEAFVKDMLPYAERSLDAFFSRSGDQGVVLFTEPRYWNFHEWSPGLDGGNIFRTSSVFSQADCNLTALVSRAAKGIAALEAKIGNAEKAEKFNRYALKLAECLEAFYDHNRGMYASYLSQGQKAGYHAYTQAVALSTGAVPESRQKALCEILKNPAAAGAVELTFAALQLKYEVLIEYGDELDFCVEEICDVFGKMLFSGATSYWETAYGEADFADAGSLCHGWSAVACYVFDKYLTNKAGK